MPCATEPGTNNAEEYFVMSGPANLTVDLIASLAQSNNSECLSDAGNFAAPAGISVNPTPTRFEGRSGRFYQLNNNSEQITGPIPGYMSTEPSATKRTTPDQVTGHFEPIGSMIPNHDYMNTYSMFRTNTEGLSSPGLQSSTACFETCNETHNMMLHQPGPYGSLHVPFFPPPFQGNSEQQNVQVLHGPIYDPDQSMDDEVYDPSLPPYSQEESQTQFGNSLESWLSFGYSTQHEKADSLLQEVERLHIQSSRLLYQHKVIAPGLLLITDVIDVQMYKSKGLEALEAFLLGDLPRSLVDMYALFHLAQACQNLLPGVRHRNALDAFDIFDLFTVSEIGRWAQLVVPQTEYDHFTSIASQLWGLDIKLVDIPSKSFTNQQQTADLANILAQGPVIQACLRYLDDFEHAGLALSRQHVSPAESMSELSSDPSLQNPMTSIMRRTIIEALLTMEDLQTFFPIIRNAARMLNNGTIVKLRELELRLLHDAKSPILIGGDWHPTLYKTLRRTLSDLCDKVSHINGQTPSYRVQHQCEDIRILQRILNSHASGQYFPVNRDLSNSWAYANNGHSTDTSPTEEVFDNACSSRRSSNQSSCYSFNDAQKHLLITFNEPEFNMDFTLNPLEISHRMREVSPMPSPKFVQDLPVKPLVIQKDAGKSGRRSSDVTSNRDADLGCPMPNCPSTFSGKRRFSKLNLKRHMDSVHKKGRSWTCMHCHKTFNRSDNRLAHMKKVHRLTIEPMRVGISETGPQTAPPALQTNSENAYL